MPRLGSRSERRLILTTDAVGGVWRYSVGLARSLVAHGVDCTIVGFGPPPDAAQRQEAERVAELHWTGQPLDWMVADSADLRGVPRALEAVAAKTGAGVIQLNLPSQAGGLETDAKVVTVSHSCIVTWFRCVRGSAPPDGWHWQQELNARGLARADRIVAPSRSHAALVRRCYPGVGEVTVVPNGAEAAAPTIVKLPFVHAAGRWWDEGKGAVTLDAAAALTDWPVLAIGPMTQEGGAPFRFAHARARGPKPHAEVLKSADVAAVFLSTSVYEPFGLAALEAAAAGAALVLSDIPTYRELWNDAALFAPPGDGAAFAEQVNRLARDPRLRRAWAHRARVRAGLYSMEAQAAAMVRLFEGLWEPQKVMP